MDPKLVINDLKLKWDLEWNLYEKNIYQSLK